MRASDIELFTAMTGDRNPIHYDPELAAATRFGGIVVQGGVTTGLLNALVAEDLPGPGSVFLQVELAVPGAGAPGDVLTAEARVLEVRADKPVTTLETTVRTGDGDRRRRRDGRRLARSRGGGAQQHADNAPGHRAAQRRSRPAGSPPAQRRSRAVSAGRQRRSATTYDAAALTAATPRTAGQAPTFLASGWRRRTRRG